MKKLNVMQVACICSVPTVSACIGAYILFADYFANYWSWL